MFAPQVFQLVLDSRSVRSQVGDLLPQAVDVVAYPFGQRDHLCGRQFVGRRRRMLHAKILARQPG